MPRTVTAQHGSMTFANRSWGMLMKLAFDSGWKPMGCERPLDWEAIDKYGNPRRFFSMDYFSRRGQRVLAADAAAIADALESGLLDVPPFDALGLKVVSSIDMPHLAKPLRSLRPGVKVNPFEYFSGDNRDGLREFIAYCRKGGFEIR
ncbi:MAG: hypothetical protein QM783_09490 [Phycisphaerales bacterium]